MSLLKMHAPLWCLALALPFFGATALFACSSNDAPLTTADAATDSALGEDAGDGAASEDVGRGRVDGGYAVGPDGAVLPDTRFATGVGTIEPGKCGGYGTGDLPSVVLGPPVGGGGNQGSLDVYTLGTGGSIVLTFGDTNGDHAIVNGPGVDFIVFENAFFIGGNPETIYAEPAEVAVSEDGVSWHALPCDGKSPYTNCAGTKPTYAGPGTGISPIDPAVAGGNAFDLEAFGVARARYVKITDRGSQTCREGANASTTNGFDLDGISVVNSD